MSLWLEPAVFPVVLDSCVLYPCELRDVLLEAAHHGLYRVHWSPKTWTTRLGICCKTSGLLSTVQESSALPWRMSFPAPW